MVIVHDNSLWVDYLGSSQLKPCNPAIPITGDVVNFSKVCAKPAIL